MRVYINRPDRTQYSINRQVALVGFTLRGQDIQLFDADELDDLPLTRDDIVVGGVGIVQGALKRLGLVVPSLDTIPASLTEFAGRRMWQSTMLEAQRAVDSGQSLFVKPTPAQTKLFGGTPLCQFSDLIPLAHIPGDTIVECSELTPFLSEFRVFVMHGDIVGVHYYTGAPLLFPDAGRVKAAVTSFENAPAAYALDVGVCEDGRTLVIEVNDGYAIGSYGLPSTIYAALIDARWAELRQDKID